MVLKGLLTLKDKNGQAINAGVTVMDINVRERVARVTTNIPVTSIKDVATMSLGFMWSSIPVFIPTVSFKHVSFEDTQTLTFTVNCEEFYRHSLRGMTENNYTRVYNELFLRRGAN